MIDFSSALYLGMTHARDEIPCWDQLTMGAPASINEDARSRLVAGRIAALQGQEEGMTAASTLHLFADLYAWLAKSRVIVFIDEFIYPVARFGAERLATNGVPLLSYRHLDARHLGSLLSRTAKENRIPIVLSDGWCPQCGKAAPLIAITALLDHYGGHLVLDDTQALGLLGEKGGGILRWSKAPPERVVIIASLAKSLGVPMAVISGPGHFIREFRANSGTMDHCSPASIAHLSAAMNALELNRSEGDSRRAMLYANVSLFRQGLFAAGLRPKGGLFPVQHLDRLPRKEVLQLYEQLQKEGIRTVVTKGHRSGDSQLTMLLRSDHRPKDIGLLTHKIIRFCSKKYFSYDNYH